MDLGSESAASGNVVMEFISSGARTFRWMPSAFVGCRLWGGRDAAPISISDENRESSGSGIGKNDMMMIMLFFLADTQLQRMKTKKKLSNIDEDSIKSLHASFYFRMSRSCLILQSLLSNRFTQSVQTKGFTQSV